MFPRELGSVPGEYVQIQGGQLDGAEGVVIDVETVGFTENGVQFERRYVKVRLDDGQELIVKEKAVQVGAPPRELGS